MYPRIHEITPRALTSRQARTRGVVLIIVGLFLTGLAMAIVAFFLDLISLSVIFPGVYRDPNAGPVSVPIAGYLFVGFFALFGLVAIAEGIWQVWFGVRNKYLTIIMIAMGTIFVAAGILVRGLS